MVDGMECLVKMSLFHTFMIMYYFSSIFSKT